MGQVKGSISNAPGLLGGPIRTTWDGLFKMLAPGTNYLLCCSWEDLFQLCYGESLLKLL
nr:hypothetical protein Q903MT_gene1385 [Picea sitchensis]